MNFEMKDMALSWRWCSPVLLQPVQSASDMRGEDQSLVPTESYADRECFEQRLH